MLSVVEYPSPRLKEIPTHETALTVNYPILLGLTASLRVGA